jgi:hypothetical protein
MEITLATAGHQALAVAPRLHAGCAAVNAYPWPVDTAIRPSTDGSMPVFDTSKATRRRKEPSP